ncbi:MAG: hypothetical protein O3A81_02430, partial [bacterium]|nr:hypothetical protein [bacterium]
MDHEPVNNQALLFIGTITAVVVAIYAGNWQADLLAQQVGGLCGNGICEQGEDQMLCPSCAIDESGVPFGNCECTMMCERDCKNDDRDDGRCQPYDCKDSNGNQPPRCTADGHPINYFVDPCTPICPSILCSEAPPGCQYVPPYKTNDQGCQVNCGKLICESQPPEDQCSTMRCENGCKDGQC